MKQMHVWIIVVIGAFIAGGILIGKKDISTMLPYVLVFICPIMMIFMMGDHTHK